MATVTNGSDKEAECDLFFKFYDSLGNLVDVEKERVYSVPPESFKVEEMYMPHTYDTYDELEFSRYEGFISAAFFYD